MSLKATQDDDVPQIKDKCDMTNPSDEFEKKLDEAAEKWKQEHGMSVQLPPLAYYGMERAFEAGARYGVGAVIEFMSTQHPEQGAKYGDAWADELRKRFQSGQARDGGKENG